MFSTTSPSINNIFFINTFIEKDSNNIILFSEHDYPIEFIWHSQSGGELGIIEQSP